MVADVTVVGTGVIGLVSAIELADRGVRVRLVGTAHRGEASGAAAGMLAPSVEAEVRIGAAHAFAMASRDRYPAYVATLEARTRIAVPLNRRGIVEVARDEATMESLRASAIQGALRLSRQDVAALEPGLGETAGGMLYPHDGCVDPLLLLDALRVLVARHERIVVVTENVTEVRVSAEQCEVRTDREDGYASASLVVAAGAWSGGIVGLPRSLSIEPMRGQMVAFGVGPLRHVVVGVQGYLVPKPDGTTMAGSTMEAVGFAPETTAGGIEAVREAAESLCPALVESAVTASWAGLRPVTPDMLPLLGRDPEYANVTYACGHSRNGILLAPLTGEVVADLVTGVVPRYDLDQFRPERF